MFAITGLFAMVVAFLVGSGLLSASTAMAGIQGRSFGKAMAATALALIAGFVVGLPMALLGIKDGLLATGVSLVTYLAVIRGVYATSWGKAFLAWILQLVVIAILLVPLIALGGAAALLR